MNNLATDRYRKLLLDITSLYAKVKQTMITTYWQMGKRIVEAEQQGAAKAPYGEQLIKRLSKDLTRRIGKGFSKTNLERMRLFYKENPIAPPVGQLPWTRHVELLSVRDPQKRRALEKRTLRQGLSREELKALVRKEKISERLQEKRRSDVSSPVPQLTVSRAVLGTYSIVKNVDSLHPKSSVILDLGFNIWNMMSKDESEKVTLTDKPAYCYSAYVERIVDGDTLWVRVDCGFSCLTRQKLRLRAIDCPELDTDEGKAAKRFVQKHLPVDALIVVKTYKDDKYGRYLTDVFYLEGEVDPHRIAREGIFLNQELLNQHLAVRV